MSGIYDDYFFVKDMYDLAKQRGVDPKPYGVPEDVFIEYWEKHHNMKLWEHGIKLIKTTTQIKKGFVPAMSIYIIWNDLEDSYPFYKGEK
jgi:hypothetical protein